MIPDAPNPAWACPDCGRPLVRAETGWVCPAMHGGIVADQLLAERLRAKSTGGSLDEWLAAVRAAARRKPRKGA